MLSLCFSVLILGTPPEPVSGAAIADFALRDPNETIVRLADFRDCEVVVVVFVGADCPLARLYGPRLGELARTYERRSVAILAIDANACDAPAAIRRYVTDHRLPFPVLIDADHAIADRFGAKRTPEAF